MRISIVTVSYNQARFLPECVESVLAQGYPDLEYIIVDPGSTDGSREIIDSLGARVTKVFEADEGPADGLNKGFALATGDVLGFVNSDDALLTGALATVAAAFASEPGADIVAGGGYLVDAESRPIRRVFQSKLTPWMYVHGAVTLFQQGMFFRRESFRAAGGFNSANMIAWDGELFLDMALVGARFVRIGQPLAVFREHSLSITGSGGQARQSIKYAQYREQVFERVMGRRRRRSDRIWDVLARIGKFGDLRYALQRAAAGKRLTVCRPQVCRAGCAKDTLFGVGG